jgi:hypothetical protein
VRLLGALALVLVLVVALSGCGEDAQQQAAREETQAYVASLGQASTYDVAESHCTESARTGWFVIVETESFVCSVRRRSGGCDWFRVDVGKTGIKVALAEPDAGCVLPE